jgi:hypothetical protein
MKLTAPRPIPLTKIPILTSAMLIKSRHTEKQDRRDKKEEKYVFKKLEG